MIQRLKINKKNVLIQIKQCYNNKKAELGEIFMKLLRVRSKGFKNCADDFCIDMLAKSKKTSEDKEYELNEIDEGLYTYTTVGIVGKNASGKTSALELLDWCYDILSTFRLSGKKYNYAGVNLEIIFYEEGYIYKYLTELDNAMTLEDNAIFKTQKIYQKKYYKTKLKEIYSEDSWQLADLPEDVPEDVSSVFWVLKKNAIREVFYGDYFHSSGSYNTTLKLMKIAKMDESIIEKVDSAIITMFANDSRGNSTSIVKPVENYIEYEPLIYNPLEVSRTDSVNSEVNIKFQGVIDIVNFGAVENSITSAKYYYKNTSSNDDFIEGTTPLTAHLSQIENNKYKFEIDQNIAGDLGANGFDINNSYLIKIVVADRIISVEDTETLGSGSPAIAIYGNNVSLGAPYNEMLGGRVQINGSIFGGYNFEEQIIGVWTNGKTLYRKVITLSDGWTTGGVAYLSSGITNAKIVRMYGFYKRADGTGGNVPNHYYNISTNGWNIDLYDFYYNSGNFRLFVGANFTGNNALEEITIIFEYTKNE